MAAQAEIITRKIVATKFTTQFRAACDIVKATIPSLGPKEILVQNKFAGINATDVNVSAGRYSVGQKPPLDMGLEGVGVIVKAGTGVPQDVVGKPVGYVWGGTFADYVKMPYKNALLCNKLDINHVPLLVSGLTASVSFEKHADLKKGETVFISAAAGGTGHIAVQLAKAAGCHVIGTCSSHEKTEFLKNIGCDRVIDYKKEDLNAVLKEEYPNGLDVVYESIGGDIFETCINRLAVKGRMILLGYISSYHSPGGVDKSSKNATLPTKLLMKSASLHGFFLMQYRSEYERHWARLLKMYDEGSLIPFVDTGDNADQRFRSLESVFDAVEYLYSRKSKGKVCVDLSQESAGSKL